MTSIRLIFVAVLTSHYGSRQIHMINGMQLVTIP